MQITRSELRAIIEDSFNVLSVSDNWSGPRVDSLAPLLAVADTADRVVFGHDTMTDPADGKLCGCPAFQAFGRDQYDYNIAGRVGFDERMAVHFHAYGDDGHIVKVIDA